MPLYNFRCARHGLIEEFAKPGARVGRCSQCGRFAARRFSAPLVNQPNFGKAMAHHTTGRRLAPAERERREWWNRSRLKGLAPPDTQPKVTRFV